MHYLQNVDLHARITIHLKGDCVKKANYRGSFVLMKIIFELSIVLTFPIFKSRMTSFQTCMDRSQLRYRGYIKDLKDNIYDLYRIFKVKYRKISCDQEIRTVRN